MSALNKEPHLDPLPYRERGWKGSRGSTNAPVTQISLRRGSRQNSSASVSFPSSCTGELDGAQHADHIQHDEVRAAFLNSRGYRVLRFWNSQVLESVEDVLHEIDGLPGDAENKEEQTES